MILVISYLIIIACAIKGWHIAFLTNSQISGMCERVFSAAVFAAIGAFHVFLANFLITAFSPMTFLHIHA